MIRLSRCSLVVFRLCRFHCSDGHNIVLIEHFDSGEEGHDEASLTLTCSLEGRFLPDLFKVRDENLGFSSGFTVHCSFTFSSACNRSFQKLSTH